MPDAISRILKAILLSACWLPHKLYTANNAAQTVQSQTLSAEHHAPAWQFAIGLASQEP